MYLSAQPLGDLSGAAPSPTQYWAAFLKTFNWTVASYSPDVLPWTATEIVRLKTLPLIPGKKVSSLPLILARMKEVARTTQEFVKAPIVPAVAPEVETELRKRRFAIADQWVNHHGLTWGYALLVAAIAVTGGVLGAAAPAGGAASAGAGGAGLTAGASAGGLSPWAASMLGIQPSITSATLGTGLVATGGSAITATALAALKKYAIDYSVEYAMGKAAEYYATQQQKKMEAAQEKALRDELTAAQAEYDQLIAAGATPESAASQAVQDSGKLPTTMIAGAAILAFLTWLLLRK